MQEEAIASAELATTKEVEGWESSFNEKFPHLVRPEGVSSFEHISIPGNDIDEIKSFIRSLLRSTRSQIIKELCEKVKNLRRLVIVRPILGAEFKRKNDPEYQERCMIYMAQSSYERALQDLLTHLKEDYKN